MVEFDEGPIAKVVRRQVVIRDVIGVETASEGCHSFVARRAQPLTVSLQLFTGINRWNRRRNPTRFEARRWVSSRADLSNPVLLSSFHNSVAHFLAVFPWAPQFPPGLPDHSMAQRPDITAGNLEHIHIKKPNVGRRLSGRLFHNLDGIRSLHLISKDLPPALIHSRPLVPLAFGFVLAGLQVVLHPIGGGRASYEIEFVFVEVKENCITNNESLFVARNKLLRLVDFESFEAVDTKFREQCERIGTFNVKIRHMVRLVKKRTGLTPRALFIPPVGKLGTHYRKGIRSNLRITQHANRIPDRA